MFSKMLLASLMVCLIAGCAQDTAPTAPALPEAGKPYVNVSPDQFEALSKQPGTVILDVRSPGEYADGHLAGAVNIELYSPDFADRVAKLDKSKTYVVHCRSGGRSSRACGQLTDKGFVAVYNLDGGLNAWTAAGKPVEK